MILGGVAAALVGAVVLALGAQLQNRGVRGSDAGAGFGIGQLLALVRSRAWLAGSGLLTLAVLLQLVGLLLAPLPVVQPLGVLSLVVTALLERRLGRARLQRRGVQGIAVCVVGVTAFVVTASTTTRSSPTDPASVAPVLVLVGAVLAVLLAGWLVLRKRLPGLVFAVAGGVCFGFVVTLMKVLLDRCADAVRDGALIDGRTPFSLLLLVGAGLAGTAGISLVQAGYAAGSTDLVVAALTVVDPITAVVVGVVLLGEARSAPVWAIPVFLVAGAACVVGVLLMARHPPVPIDGSER